MNHHELIAKHPGILYLMAQVIVREDRAVLVQFPGESRESIPANNERRLGRPPGKHLPDLVPELPVAFRSYHRVSANHYVPTVYVSGEEHPASEFGNQIRIVAGKAQPCPFGLFRGVLSGPVTV